MTYLYERTLVVIRYHTVEAYLMECENADNLSLGKKLQNSTYSVVPIS